MHVKARKDWSSDDLLSVAELIVNPETNGGTVADLNTQKLAAMLPDMPAWGVFKEGRAVLVVGLWPYNTAARDAACGWRRHRTGSVASGESVYRDVPRGPYFYPNPRPPLDSVGENGRVTECR
jgi:hypothetical protein